MEAILRMAAEEVSEAACTPVGFAEDIGEKEELNDRSPEEEFILQFKKMLARLISRYFPP